MPAATEGDGEPNQQASAPAPALGSGSDHAQGPSNDGGASADEPPTLEAVLGIVLRMLNGLVSEMSPDQDLVNAWFHGKHNLRLASRECRRLVDSAATRVRVPDMAHLLKRHAVVFFSEATGQDEQAQPCPQALLRLLPRLGSLRQLDLEFSTPGWCWLDVELGSVLCHLSAAAPQVMAGVRALRVTRRYLLHSQAQADREELAMGPVVVTSATMHMVATTLPGLQVCSLG